VYLCQFPFTSGSGGKIRPALVLFDLQVDAIICRITSVLHTEPLDVRLREWHAAGLLKPSVARLGRLVTTEKTVFLKRLGALSPGDASTIRMTWNRLMKLG
jgi:hypothetical protein